MLKKKLKTYFGKEKLLFVVLLFFLFSSSILANSPKEYEVKAAFLLKFHEFVELKVGNFSEKNKVLNLGIVGDDPFESVFSNKMIFLEKAGYQFKIFRSNEFDELKDCQILFFSNIKNRYKDRILSQIKEKPILTVGEGEDFLFQGGIISFIMEGSKVRFLVNIKNAEQAGLKINSRLLRLARKVFD
jgi:hypothetical protein